MKFEIGDRVRCIKEFDGNSFIVGECGKVIKSKEGPFTSLYCIEFDSNIKGHSGNDIERLGENGHCWWLPEQCLDEEITEIVINIKDKTVKVFSNNRKLFFENQIDVGSTIKNAIDTLFSTKKIKVGDTVEIVDEKCLYKHYDTWVNKNAPNFAVYYQYGRCLVDHVGSCTYQVVAKSRYSEDLDHQEPMLYLIQKDDKSCYLIGESGIEKVLNDYTI